MSFTRTGLLAAAFLMLLVTATRAFPPAVDAIIYGTVKDQFGTPLTIAADQVILQTPSGVQVVAHIQPGIMVGANYILYVPMDTGKVGGPYTAAAQLAGNQYKLLVSVGTTTNLPIEMTGGYSVLGIPSSYTRQDLTLGTDANGDGIPDAWETQFLSQLGVNIALANINPNTDYAHNGRTLKQEYLLGNYPYNPGDNFNVQMVSLTNGSVVLAFTTMTARTYSVQGSSDLQNWTPLSFSIPAAGPGVMTAYYSSTIQPLQIQTVQPTNAPTMQFFRMALQ